MPSQHNQILTACQTLVSSLNLQLDGNAVQIEQRLKLDPEDGFAGSPTLVVALHGNERREYAFAGPNGLAYWVWYSGIVGLVTSGRLEPLLLSNDAGLIIDWRKDLASLLALPSNWGLHFLSNVELDYQPPIDPRWVEQGMDVSAIGWTVETLE